MINCTITSLNNTSEYNDLRSIMIPALSGQMQILTNHAESFILLDAGNVILKDSGKNITSVKISGGECHIQNNSVTIIL